MFKWIRGFISGTLLTIYISSIGLLSFYIWLIKDAKGYRKNHKNYRHYSDYSKK